VSRLALAEFGDHRLGIEAATVGGVALLPARPGCAPG
jgi:hypothetical protein